MQKQETAPPREERAGAQNRRKPHDAAKAGIGSRLRPKLPAGPGFMPRMGLKRLAKLVRSTKDGVERTRLQAAKVRNEGKSIGKMGAELCKPYLIVRDWPVKLHKRGPRGMFNKRRGRRRRTLSNAILRDEQVAV